MAPFLTVVVAISTPDQPLAQCLNALRQQQLPPTQFEVVVIDEANSPETAALVAAFAQSSHIETRYLAQPKPAGLAAARNRGWQAARSPYIAFTDVDCLPQPGWLLAAQTMFRRGAQVLTGPVRTLVPPQAGRQTLATKKPAERAEFLAANCFCGVEALRRAGGFEESSALAWRAEADFQFKLLDIGIPIVPCPEAVVFRPQGVKNRYEALKNEHRHRHDALLYKRHPNLFRQRIPRNEGLALRHYATLISLVVALIAAGMGQLPVLLFGALTYLALTAWLALDQWRSHTSPTANAWQTVQETLLTALATPFLSIFWRAYGSVKHRVLYW